MHPNSFHRRAFKPAGDAIDSSPTRTVCQQRGGSWIPVDPSEPLADQEDNGVCSPPNHAMDDCLAAGGTWSGGICHTEDCNADPSAPGCASTTGKRPAPNIHSALNGPACTAAGGEWHVDSQGAGCFSPGSYRAPSSNPVLPISPGTSKAVAWTLGLAGLGALAVVTWNAWRPRKGRR